MAIISPPLLPAVAGEVLSPQELIIPESAVVDASAPTVAPAPAAVPPANVVSSVPMK